MSQPNPQHSVRHLSWHGLWSHTFRTCIPQKMARLLHEWLSDQRWFLEKQSSNWDLTLHQAIPVLIEGHLLWWLFLKVTTDQGHRVYQVPLVVLDDPNNTPPIARLTGHQTGWLIDAWSWPPLAEWVLSNIARIQQGNIPPNPALIDPNQPAGHIQAWHIGKIDTDVAAEPLNSEQSNTAIRFGNRYFLKVFRSVHSGEHPEMEMSMMLTGQSFILPVLGGLGTSGPTWLALLYQYVPNLGNGWNWFRSAISSMEGEAPTEPSATTKHLIAAAHQLGVRTQQLHQHLGKPNPNPAFTPHAFTATDYDQLQSRITNRYHSVCKQLKTSKGRPGPCAHLVIELNNFKPVLKTLAATSFPTTTTQCHRIHGDYHLGQVLRSENDWLIIDFEGEPLRSLEERRAKDLPWRDVAGMLRSFDYLAHDTWRARLLPSCQRDNNSLPQRQDLYYQLQSAFLTGYLGKDPATLDSDSQRLLKLYELEKALYEIEYELASRPDWLSIPLAGVVELLSGL